MLELKHLAFSVAEEAGQKDILRDVSLTVPDGAFWVITGPNGGGKTSLAKTIMGLNQPTGGQILWNGEDITALSITERARRGISYGFQQPPRFKGLRVRDLLGLAAGNPFLSRTEGCQLLTQVGLCAADYIDREVDASLSGGEVKRIEIATILARKAPLMIFDEPEAGIDLWSFAKLTETFRYIHDKRESTIIIISHQERIIGLADEIVLVADGLVSEQGPRDEIFPKILANTQPGCAFVGEEGPAMNQTDQELLKQIADMDGVPEGAYNIRKDGGLDSRRSTETIQIDTKQDKPGIDIRIKAGTKGQDVHIPVLLTQSGLNDLVYNDFFIGEDCDVDIIAGCGIHNDGCDTTQHDGVHTFYVGKNSKVRYTEKHYGEGEGSGQRVMNPHTIVYLEEGASIQLETVQIKGVDHTKRYTRVELDAGAEAVVTERLLTHGEQFAESKMDVIMKGEGARTQVISRSVAQDQSVQVFYPQVEGNAPCFGHVQCDSIIMGQAKVSSIPAIVANHMDAQLIHEAAIGKIAGDQILKLMTLGLTEEEAEQKILDGFLR